MSSKREAAIAALAAELTTALTPVEVVRDETRTRSPNAAGLVIVREGEQRDAIAMMSPLSYIVAHDAEVLVIVPHATTIGDARTDLDDLLTDIVTALADNRTLDGAVDWLDLNGSRFEAIEDDGSGALLAAVLTVTLHFVAADSPSGE